MKSKPADQADLGVLRAELKIPKASDIIAARIKQEIIVGRFPAGMALPAESDLCRWLGMGRSTVREALRMLEIDGIIEFKTGPKGGAIARRPSPSVITRSLALMSQFEQTKLADLLEARREIEPACARLAAERATDEDLTLIESTINRMPDPFHDRRVVLQSSAEFHVAVAAAAKNDILRLLTFALHEFLNVCIADVHDYDEMFSDETRDVWGRTHRRILEAIRDRDAERAERRMRRHLLAFEDQIQIWRGRLDSRSLPISIASF